MISQFVTLLLTITFAGCALHKPHTVQFSSKNLMTHLTWEPATASSNETLYQVEYKLLGDGNPWIQKMECWNISMVQCDLTKDIAHATDLVRGHVRAVSHSNKSDWVDAKMSMPRRDMKIDPPTFHLEPETNSMQVHIHPYFENNSDVKKMEYLVDLRQKNGKLLFAKTAALHTERVEDLAPGTEYCVSVSSKIWINRSQPAHHDRPYQSVKREACAITEADQRHLQLIMHLSVGLIMPLLLLSALLLLTLAFRSIYRPSAPLPLNLTFTVEEWKTLQKKAYVDTKQYDDDSLHRNTRNWVQSEAKTNLYVKLPQTIQESEQSVDNSADEPLMGFSTPPPLLENVRRVQGYAPQLSFPAAPTDESYGVVHHGPGLINAQDFSCADRKTGCLLAPSSEPLYINSEHPEPVYANSEHPQSVYANSEHPEPVYTNSERPRSVHISTEQPEPVYANNKCSEPVYTNFEQPKSVDTSSSSN